MQNLKNFFLSIRTELSLFLKLSFSNPYIFATQYEDLDISNYDLCHIKLSKFEILKVYNIRFERSEKISLWQRLISFPIFLSILLNLKKTEFIYSFVALHQSLI